MPQISEPFNAIEAGKKEGCAVSTQEAAAEKEWEMQDSEHFYRLLQPIAVPLHNHRPPRIANQLTGGS
jgi:hypothetical protein